MQTLLVTGSSGLVGSACVEHFHRQGWRVCGIDNNQRAALFGQDGDTSGNLARLKAACPRFEHRALDVRDRDAIFGCVASVQPGFVIHCAAQPSHDLAAARPLDDFEINALGTLHLLEATRRYAPDAAFCFLSTNKVYGDAPNELPLREEPTRWDYALPEHRQGIDESLRIDQSLHSPFGASKAAADLLVQEYGRYYGMQTVCFRCGCLTGAAHAAAEQHGFLAYLMRCIREDRLYRIYGYQGKQVRDNLHVIDVCRAIDEFFRQPRCGGVYNLGGGRAGSVSVVEAISLAEKVSGKKLRTQYVAEARRGDHLCYISNCGRFCRDYPGWSVTVSLEEIFQDLWHGGGASVG